MTDQYPDLSQPLDEYPDLSQPVSSVSSNAPNDNQMVDTFLGKMPDISNPEIRKQFLTPPTKEDMQRAGAVGLPFVAPEIRALPFISNMLSKVPGATSVGNMLGRIGYGTALTTAPSLFSDEGRKNIGDTAKTNALLNTAIEGITIPFRGLSTLAELFNPIKYARSKAAIIKSEHDATKSVMEENYAPINNAYGDFTISVTPENYLKKSGINKDSLYADAQGYYQDFVNEPTYKNLLNLKSQIGRDWASISPEKNMVRDTQLFSRYRNTLDNKLKNFLSRDPEAAKQYDIANRYAENVYYPYLSSPTLKTISKGKYNAIYPDRMAKSIEKATERVVGQEYRYRIPENHPLRNHLKDLQNRLTVGDVSEIAIPALGGALLGGLSGNSLAPGYGSYAGGAGGFITGALAGLGGSKLLRYPIVQSPGVQNAFSKIAPYYYNSARAAVEAADENQ